MSPAGRDSWRRWLPQRPLIWWQGLALAGVCLAASTAARTALQPAVGAYGIPFMTYFPAVLVASVWGGFFGGGAAVAGAMLLSFVLFMSPELKADRPAAIGTMVSFFASAALLVVVGSLLGRSVRELSRREGQLNTLADELAHRAKNGFAVVQAIVSQSARSAETVRDLERTVQARIGAMAQAQDLITPDLAESARLEDVIPSVLAPFDLARFTVTHSARVLTNRTLTLGLALIFHELATNAVKYGALSQPGGRIEVRVAKLENGRAQVIWRESGGPPVSEPTKRGFGARLLVTALAPHQGASEMKFDPQGVEVTFAFSCA